MVDDRCQSYQGSSPCRWCPRGKSGNGPHKRGLNTKLHLAVDSHGMPVRLILTQGTTADCSQAIALIQGIQAEHLLADKGYDSNEIVTAALARGINPVIPPKSNRKDPRYYEQDLYKLRHLVENAFLHLKQWRAVATRYAKRSLLSSPSARSGRWYFGLSYFDDTP